MSLDLELRQKWIGLKQAGCTLDLQQLFRLFFHSFIQRISRQSNKGKRKIKRIFNPILGYIEENFGFLFDRGFQIREANVSFWSSQGPSWDVTFESQDYIIKVLCDEHEVILVFAPSGGTANNSMRLESILYYLSKGKNFIGKFEGDYLIDKKGQIERLANLLKENIDQILPCFEMKWFREHVSELLEAEKEWAGIYMRRYVAGF